MERKEEEMRRKEEELLRERRRADEAEQRNRRLEQEKEQEKQEKEKKEAELKKLKDENENLKSNQKQQIEKPIQKLPQDFPIAILIINLEYQDFSDINGVMKMITQKQECNICSSLTQVMENGIWELEAQFNTAQRDGMGALGIVQDTFNIPVGHGPSTKSSTAFFCGKGYNSNGIVYVKNGNNAQENAAFTNNQILKIEYDSGKGTLHLFVDGAQQPIYISGIDEKVRFF
ncbi:MAG: hypothetical protein EZS28_049273, partial [Streblomastix strix]